MRLTGARILRLERRAKYLLFPLDTGEVMLAHLGMTGRFHARTEQAAVPVGQFYNAPSVDKHCHVQFRLDSGASIDFLDPRRFGFMDLFEDKDRDHHPRLVNLGPEPLGPDFSADHLKSRFKGRAQPIKAALLDQSHVAGLGNIYVCEALFRSGISPTRAAGDIGEPSLNHLVREVIAVLNAALEAGGSSLRDFANAEGAPGYFQHDFLVYDRENEPCPNCSRPIERLVQSGRSSFHCPTCQT